MNRFFKRSWDEVRGDEYDSWGTSTYYFELDNDGFPLRQIEVYENGNRLKYSAEKLFDDYGGLGNQSVDIEEFIEYEISQEVFEQEWEKSNLKKEHQEIIDLLSEFLSNHYSQRFGHISYYILCFFCG